MMYDWEAMKDVILDLYVAKDLPLKDVESIMRQQYGFCPCTRAYRDRFKKWHVTKYLKHDNASYSRDPSSGSPDFSPEHGYSAKLDEHDPPAQDRRHANYYSSYSDAYERPPVRPQRPAAPPHRAPQQEPTTPRFGGMFSSLPPRQARPSSSQQQTLLSPPWTPNTSPWTPSVMEPNTTSQYTGLDYASEQRPESRRYRRGHSRVSTSPLPGYDADQINSEHFQQGWYFAENVHHPDSHTSYSAALPYRPSQSGRSEVYLIDEDRWSPPEPADRENAPYPTPGHTSYRDRQRSSGEPKGKAKKRNR